MAAPRRSRVVLPIIFGTFAVGYLADRITKILALRHLDPANPPSYLGGFLHLRLISNPGAAFSMGSGATVVISAIALLAFLGVLGFVVPRVRRTLSAWATGLALAGISGNLTDRLTRPPGPFRGEVVDFISLPHFAIFNVADICITCTALLVLAGGFRADRQAADAPARATEDAAE